MSGAEGETAGPSAPHTTQILDTSTLDELEDTGEEGELIVPLVMNTSPVSSSLEQRSRTNSNASAYLPKRSALNSGTRSPNPNRVSMFNKAEEVRRSSRGPGQSIIEVPLNDETECKGAGGIDPRFAAVLQHKLAMESDDTVHEGVLDCSKLEARLHEEDISDPDRYAAGKRDFQTAREGKPPPPTRMASMLQGGLDIKDTTDKENQNGFPSTAEGAEEFEPAEGTGTLAPHGTQVLNPDLLAELDSQGSEPKMNESAVIVQDNLNLEFAMQLQMSLHEEEESGPEKGRSHMSCQTGQIVADDFGAAVQARAQSEPPVPEQNVQPDGGAAVQAPDQSELPVFEQNDQQPASDTEYPVGGHGEEEDDDDLPLVGRGTRAPKSTMRLSQGNQWNLVGLDEISKSLGNLERNDADDESNHDLMEALREVDLETTVKRKVAADREAEADDALEEAEGMRAPKTTVQLSLDMLVALQEDDPIDGGCQFNENLCMALQCINGPEDGNNAGNDFQPLKSTEPADIDQPAGKIDIEMEKTPMTECNLAGPTEDTVDKQPVLPTKVPAPVSDMNPFPQPVKTCQQPAQTPAAPASETRAPAPTSAAQAESHRVAVLARLTGMSQAQLRFENAELKTEVEALRRALRRRQAELAGTLWKK